MHPLLAVDLTGIGTLILAAATACLALLTRREVQNSDENIRIAGRSFGSRSSRTGSAAWSRRTRRSRSMRR
jgi:hypothetical protein